MRKALKSVICIVTAAAACSLAIACNSKVPELYEIADGARIHTELQANYLAGAYNNIAEYASGTEELSRPAPIVFEWSDTGARSYELEISQYRNFVEPIKIKTAEPRADVYNLMTGTEYFWRVRAGNKLSSVSSFTTASGAPRNLYIDGITNARDLGGWSTWNGKTVKQGMIIRCGRLNKSEQPEVEIEITEDGIEQMRDVLGIVTEIDLRMPDTHNTETGGITSSPLGSDINYVNIPMEWVMSSSFNYLSDPQYYPAIKEFFSVAANPENYPMIYHCNIGTDRTGLYAFLINGLLGVSEEDLYRDYLFSNFGSIGGARKVDNIRSYVNKAKSYSGATLSEKIENCLLDIGVKQSDITAIKSIMLE